VTIAKIHARNSSIGILLYKVIYMSMSSLTIAFLLITAPQASAEKPVCAVNSDQCVPLFACVEATGKYSRGRAQGDENGSIYTKPALGPECVGIWEITFFGFRRA
jgi:hypothetical protein